MADVITSIGHTQPVNNFASTDAENLAFELLNVTLDGADAVIYCNHVNKGTINTKAIRQAVAVMVTPTNGAAWTAGTGVLMGGAVISKTTYTGDTVTISGVTTGTFDVLIIGRT